MNEVPALSGIIAKILVMIDQTLGAFASVSETTAFGACNITAYNVQVNECGEALIASLSDLFYYAIQLITGLMMSLQAVT